MDGNADREMLRREVGTVYLFGRVTFLIRLSLKVHGTKVAYTVKVKFTDNGDGTLTATSDKSRDQIKFTNTYTPPENPTVPETKGV